MIEKRSKQIPNDKTQSSKSTFGIANGEVDSRRKLIRSGTRTRQTPKKRHTHIHKHIPHSHLQSHPVQTVYTIITILSMKAQKHTRKRITKHSC